MPARRSQRIAGRGEPNETPGNASNLLPVVRLRRIRVPSVQSDGPRGGRVLTRTRGRGRGRGSRTIARPPIAPAASAQSDGPRGRRVAARTRGRGRGRRTITRPPTSLAAGGSTSTSPGRQSVRIATRGQQESATSLVAEASSSDENSVESGESFTVGRTAGQPAAVLTYSATLSELPSDDVATGVRPIPLVHSTRRGRMPIGAAADSDWLQNHSLVQRLFRFESGIPTEGDPITITRLRRELCEFSTDQTEGCKVEMVGDNLFHWVATIPGPSETVYEGGHFRVEIVFPRNYPFQPPYVAFLTKIYHCNIAFSGRLCLDILSSKWSPALSISKMLISIMSLLADPNPNDPLELGIAETFKRNRGLHDQNARDWTRRFAKQ